MEHLGQGFIDTAALHDVIEDSNVTLKDLIDAGLCAEVVYAVGLLTRRAGQDEFDYLSNIKNNDLAREVKIADMISNLADKPTDKQKSKYARALNYLINNQW